MVTIDRDKQTDLQIAATSALYTCADCEDNENYEHMCHPADRVWIIGGKVICDDCRENGHLSEDRRQVPDLTAALAAKDARIAALEGALKPFANAEQAQPDKYGPEKPVIMKVEYDQTGMEFCFSRGDVTVGDFTRARALQDKGEG